jgi:hypothetical protein
MEASMTGAELAIIVGLSIAVLILAKGVGLVVFIFYRWLQRTLPA